MRRIALLFALPLAACGSSTPVSEFTPTPQPTAALSEATPSPTASPTTRDYTPPQLTPEAEKSEKGARNLLLAWAAAMEDRAYGAAYALFGEYAERSGMSESEYTAAFASYATVTVAIGDGEAEGAAGSSYYQAPITLSGRLTDGSAYQRTGTITLRRVNDVPGATPAQLKWHLDKLEWDE